MKKQQQTNQFDNLVTRRVHSGMLRRAVALMSAFVLFMTMNTLKFEADALERIPTCGYPTHEHTDTCFDESGELTCEAHVHTDACFQARPVDVAATRLDEYIPLNANVNLYADPAQDGEDDTVTAIDPVDETVAETEVNLVTEESPLYEAEEDSGLSLDGEETVPEEIESTVTGETETEDVPAEPKAPVEEIAAESYSYEIGADAQVALAEILEKVGLEPGDIYDVCPATSDIDRVAIEADADGAYTVRSLASYDKAEIVVIAADGEFIIALTDAEIEETIETEPAEDGEETEDTEDTKDDETAATEAQPEEDGEDDNMEEKAADAEPEADEQTDVEEEQTTVEPEADEETEETTEEEENEEQPADAQLTVHVDFAEISKTGIDFEQDAVVSAQDEGVELDVNELLVASDNTNLGVVVAAEAAPEEVVQEVVNTAALAVVETTGGVEYADGAITVTADGTATLTDGVNSVVVSVDNYAELVPEVTGADNSIRVRPVSDTAVLPDVDAVFTPIEDEGNAIESAIAEKKGEDAETVTDDEGRVGVRTMNVQVFDIGLGDEVEPGFDVVVEATFGQAIQGQDFELYHIVDGVPELVENAEFVADDESATGMAFVTNGFSPYAVVWYTVEFHNGDDEVVIDGGTQILLSELIDRLKITNEAGEKIDVLNVASVEFTNDKLIEVKQVSGEITYNGQENFDVGEKDFLLTSKEPFGTDEVLTIVMANGEVISVGVTDAMTEDTAQYTKMDKTVANPFEASLTSDLVYDENSKSYSAKFKLDFLVNKAQLQIQPRYYIELADGVSIPDSALNLERVAKDNGSVSFRYKYVKDPETNRYRIYIEYDQEYISNVDNIDSNYISFTAEIGENNLTGTDKKTVKVTTDLSVDVPTDKIDYPENMTVNSDIKTQKSYEGYEINSDNIITVKYKTVVSTEKGTKGAVSINDVLNIWSNNTGYAQNEEPKINANSLTLTIKKYGKNDSTGTVVSVEKPEVTHPNDDGNKYAFNLALDELKEGERYEIEYSYSYDKAYAPSENLSSGSYNVAYGGNNSVRAESGTPDEPIHHDGSGSYDIRKSGNPVSVDKSAQVSHIDEKEYTVDWTIKAIFNATGTYSGPYKVVDEAFASRVGDITITDANGNAVTPKSISGNTIEFNGPGEYTIKYTTKETRDGFASKNVTNTATGHNGGSNDDGTATVNIPASGTIEKSLDKAQRTGTNGSNKLYTLTWTVNIPIPDGGFAQGTVITDTVGMYIQGDGNNVAANMSSLTKSEMDQKFADALGFNVTEVSGASSVTTNEKGECVYTLTLPKAFEKPVGQDVLTITYNTTAEVNPSTIHSKTAGGNADEYRNEIKVGDISGKDAWKYSEFVKKVDNKDRAKKISEHVANRSDANSRYLTWYIALNFDSDYESVRLEELLPAGLQLVHVGVGEGPDFYYPLLKESENDTTYRFIDGTNLNAMNEYESAWAIGNDKFKDLRAYATIDSDNKIDLRLQLEGEKRRPATFATDGTLYVHIKAYIPDDQFDNYANIVKEYSNTVNVYIGNNTTPDGSDTQTQKITLVSETLEKGADVTHFNGEGENNYSIDYTVYINKDGHHLFYDEETNEPVYGKTLTLEDKLAYVPRQDGTTAKSFTVMLDPDSVKLQYYNGSEWVDYVNPADPWTYTFDERTAEDGETKEKVILVKGIPDDTKLRLLYAYEVDVAETQEGDREKLPTLHNTATLTGSGTTQSSDDTNVTWNYFTSDAGTTSSRSLTILKVDSDDYNKNLSGAKFQLQKWNNSTKAWEAIDAIPASSVKVNGKGVYVTNSKGVIQIAQAKSDPKFETNVAYRLEEVEAPTGYTIKEDKKYVYFYFSSDSGEMVWPQVNGAEDTTYKSKASDLSKKKDNLRIENVKQPELIITKSFKGQTILDADKNKVEFTVKDDADTAIKKIGYSDFTNGVYVLKDTDGIQNNKTYTVTESNMVVDGVVRTTTYSINSRPLESSDDDAVTASVPVRLGEGRIDFTNYYGKAEILAYKVWNDEEDKAEARPTTVTFQLQQDGKDYADPVTVSKDDTVDTHGWAYKWTNLDYAHEYTVKEISVPGYNTAIQYTNASGETVDSLNESGVAVITNTFTGVKVNKVWVGSGSRPTIYVKLYKRANSSDGWTQESQVELTEANGWTYIWGNLDANYQYKVEEISHPQNYVTEYSVNGGTAQSAAPENVAPGDSVTITNTSTLTYVEVEKKWLNLPTTGFDRQNQMRVTLKLYRKQKDNAAAEWQYHTTKELYEGDGNDWVARWDNLDQNYLYKVVEDPKSNFTVVYSSENEQGIPSGRLTVTNIYNNTDSDKVGVQKVWLDGDGNPLEEIPEGVTIKGTIARKIMKPADGTYYTVTVESKNLSNETKWSKKYYVQKAENATIKLGVAHWKYDTEITYGSNNFEIKNSNWEARCEIAVDGDITVTLKYGNHDDLTENDFPHPYGDNNPVIVSEEASYNTQKYEDAQWKSFELSASNNWAQDFDAPADAEGEKSYYYIKQPVVEGTTEAALVGYTSEFLNNDGIERGTITVVNTEEDSNYITATKQWALTNGEAWPDGIASVQVKLQKKTASGSVVDLAAPTFYGSAENTSGLVWSATRDIASGGKATWAHLDALAAGESYVVSEVSVTPSAGAAVAVSNGKVTIGEKTYDVSVSEVANKKATVTNTETVSLEIDKAWSPRVPSGVTEVEAEIYKIKTVTASGGTGVPVYANTSTTYDETDKSTLYGTFVAGTQLTINVSRNKTYYVKQYPTTGSDLKTNQKGECTVEIPECSYIVIAFQETPDNCDITLSGTNYVTTSSTTETKVDTVKLTAGEGWHKSVNLLDYVDEGESLSDLTFYVKETTNVQDFTVTYSPAEDPATDHSAAIASGSVTITNTKDTPDNGSLKIIKAIADGSNTSTTQTFTFSVTLKDANNQNLTSGVKVTNEGGTETTVTPVNGVVTVTTTGAGEAIIADLPEGTTYSVAEASVNGWRVSSSVGVTGAISAGTQAEAIVTNEEITDFDVTKAWKDGDTIVAWPAGVTSITLTMERGTTESDGSFTTRDAAFGLTLTVTASGVTVARADGKTSPADVAGITGTVTPANGVYAIHLDGLEKYSASAGAWIYRVSEAPVNGYQTSYFTSGNAAKPDSEYAYNDEKIVNTLVTYTLPSTGGRGTTIFYGAGLSLMLLAALGFVLTARKRSREEGI